MVWFILGTKTTWLVTLQDLCYGYNNKDIVNVIKATRHTGMECLSETSALFSDASIHLDLLMWTFALWILHQLSPLVGS